MSRIHLKPPGRNTWYTALIFRTAALLVILYQIRLLAADLADTPVFIAALAGGIGAAIFLNRRPGIRPYQALIILALVPWVIRLVIALPRWFVPGVSGLTIVLDSLLLNLDRNNFSALIPFYWIAATTYFSLRSRIFLRADIISSDTIFLVIFSIAPTASMGAYRWPVLMIGLFILVLFLQILSLILSVPGELKLRKKERISAASFLFLLAVLGGVFFIRPFQERAVEKGGGLLEPKLFRFDFSQILKLESEISVNDDLVLIAKKDPDDTHTLLRRYTLSGYSPKQGFYRLDDIDEAAHPQRLPNRPVKLQAGKIKSYRITDQEYYLVNFDASAFIGMNMPVEVTPFETWDASSFSSAYAVKSYTSEALPLDLMKAVQGNPGPGSPGLSAEEYAVYTEYGKDEAIASFAREITAASSFRDRKGTFSPSYWEKIQMIYDRLKYGEYRYSLKPGIAPDGDQLKYFLFTAKKGYCSYYAFAFTLMLRSLGIPCRVAAGFFIDPSTEAFNYYPVRSDMAHAWVEVWFPGYGWIEYDPTSQEMAEGEEFRFSQGTPPELFERLMKEILDNHSRLRAKEGKDAQNNTTGLAAIRSTTINFVKQTGPFLAPGLIVFLFLAMRSGRLWLYRLYKKPRKKALCLWAHTKRRLALAGFRRTSFDSNRINRGEAEWAKIIDTCFYDAIGSPNPAGQPEPVYSLYLDAAAARFARDYTSRDCKNMVEHYRLFSESYRDALPQGRRLLAWLLPPAALVLGRGKGIKTTGIVLAIFLLLSLRGTAQDYPDMRTGDPASDALYNNAQIAAGAENWERAIELLSLGAKTYPSDYRFPWSLGNLYYHRRLYRLAWDEYRQAEKTAVLDNRNLNSSLLFQLANTAGYLNRNDVSAHYLEKVLALEPDNREAIGDLAWMYFKLHRLEDGERLLLGSIKNIELEPDFSMTLGTIYSDMFRYDDAKNCYLNAIKGADLSGNQIISALAHYNLSILESRFYLYSLAYDQTNASLEKMNRSSGRLARGELYMRRMELPPALEEYQEAYAMDNSPLSKLNLAQAFQIGGRLTEATLYAMDCLRAGDDSWMLNYGIDPVRYKRDIHEVLKDSYDGLRKAEIVSCPDLWSAGSAREWLQSRFRVITYKFRGAVHTQLFRKYSLLAADAYGRISSDSSAGEIHLDALTQYYNAFFAYRQRALAYLRKARDFEEPIIPGSAPSYAYEEGRLLHNRDVLAALPAEFDPLWERDMIAKVFAELASWGAKPESQDAAERLFALNRGGLLQNGTRLPVNLEAGNVNSRTGNMLAGIIRAAGMEIFQGDASRYTLTFNAGREGFISCELYDGGRGIILYKQELPLPSLSGSSRAAFAKALRDGIFNAYRN